MDIETTKERLENWKQWARNKKHYRITPSLEGKYRPPPSWNPPEPSIQVDINDALKVEKVLVSPTFPSKSRNLIIYAYITPQLDIHYVCRKLGINKRNLEADLQTAINILHNRLI
jgi:hypothetical protein